MGKAGIGFKRDAGGDRRDSSIKAIETLFSPEFRNRLDAVIQFNALDQSVMEQIVDKFIGELNERLKEKRAVITLTDRARARLAERGYDPAYGARPMGRLIQTEIKDAIADELLFGDLGRGGEIVVDLADGVEDGRGDVSKVTDLGPSGEFVFTYKPQHAASAAN